MIVRFQVPEEQITLAVTPLPTKATPLVPAAEPILPQSHPEPKERHLGQLGHLPVRSTWYVLGGAVTWVRGFVNSFLRVPLVSRGSREAAIQLWNS